MSVADAPAGETHLDVVHLGLIVAVAIRDEQQVGWGAEPQPIEAHRDRRRERDVLQEHLAGVGDAVAVGVLEDQDAAVTMVGEALPAGLIVAVLGDPHPAAVVPAKRHRLGHHRLAGEGVDLEAILDVHLSGRLLRVEVVGSQLRIVLLFGQLLATPCAPLFIELLRVRLALVGEEPVAEGRILAGGDRPVALSCTARPDAKLAIDPPHVRKPIVLRVVKNRDVPFLLQALDLYADILPSRALALARLIAVALRVEGMGVDAFLPRHA